MSAFSLNQLDFLTKQNGSIVLFWQKMSKRKAAHVLPSVFYDACAAFQDIRCLRL